VAAHENLQRDQFPPPRGLSYPAPLPGQRGTINPRNVYARPIELEGFPEAHEVLDYTGSRHTVAGSRAEADQAVARRRRTVAAMVTGRRNKGQPLTF
jgi:hypothetical protein